ncbi:MAG: hypothetical protein HYR64_06350 [Fimbriimonas ginsengisoli]|uniref:Formamidopyrimidine-DNA glycosylase catalytic domain-containing protein n=1 Tax=Fimbriimonas ginsengisoli TaxID=1005039 RepID=A0A931LVZ9_FIMGI|nr:hypothetical protein [Fimbriimonas ginsengisoli]
MPELPEVETACRVMRRALLGKRVAEVEVVPDTIVFGGAPPEAIAGALKGHSVVDVGRRGKTWWLTTDAPGAVIGHLGMSGWIRHLGQPTIRLKEHGDAPLDDPNGRPRFLKLLITAEDGCRVALTDGRRLARVWIAESAEKDRKIKALGPDAYDALPNGEAFARLFKARKAPIKAILMDQKILAGIGNWLADEVLYHARIAPAREAGSLSAKEYAALREQIEVVLRTAVELGADEHKYPKGWMFHFRWGGSRGHEMIEGREIRREQVGGRTTAWVPSLQK